MRSNVLSSNRWRALEQSPQINSVDIGNSLPLGFDLSILREQFIRLAAHPELAFASSMPRMVANSLLIR